MRMKCQDTDKSRKSFFQTIKRALSQSNLIKKMMPNPNDPTPQNAATQPPPPPAAADLESGAAGGGGVSNIVERWKREDLLQKGSLASRALGFIFSFLALVIMASNNHGDWKNFYHYDEYNYVVAIAFMSAVYTGLQSWRQIHKLKTNKEMLSWRNVAAVDFCGDQISAYLLISAASSAIPLTNSMREGADNVFTDASSAAISMTFFAFLSLALSSLISGFKLSTLSYI